VDLSQPIVGPHVARYRSPAVYYTFAFSLPPKSQIREVAESLLRRDLARAARSSEDAAHSFSHRFRELAKLRRLIESVSTIDELLTGKIGVFKWAAQHPHAFLHMVRERMITIHPFKRQQKGHLDPGLAKSLKKLKKGLVKIDKRMLDRAFCLVSPLRSTAVFSFLLILKVDRLFASI
jgi:hypothetical protein